MPILPISIAEDIIGVVDDLIGDKDLDTKTKAQIRLAVAKANSTWNPKSIVSLFFGITLGIYLSMIEFGGHLFGVHVPVFWDVIALHIGLWAIAEGVDIGKIADKLPELVKKLRERG